MLKSKVILIALVVSVFAFVLSCGGDSPTPTGTNDTTGQASSPSSNGTNNSVGQVSSPSSNGTNNSIPSSGNVSSIPAAVQVTGLRAEIGPAGIAVSWDAVPNSESYELYWAQGTSVSILSSHLSVPTNSFLFLSPNPEQGRQYSFAVRAISAADGQPSQMSAPITVTFGATQDTANIVATPIGFNASTIGIVNTRNDFIWYTFTAQPGIHYTIAIRDGTNSTNPALTATVRTSIFHGSTATPVIENSTLKDFPIHVDQATVIYIRVGVQADFYSGGFQIRVSDGN